MKGQNSLLLKLHLRKQNLTKHNESQDKNIKSKFQTVRIKSLTLWLTGEEILRIGTKTHRERHKRGFLLTLDLK